MKSGVPQVSILCSILFLIYLINIPNDRDSQIALIANDTILYNNSIILKFLTKYLQSRLNVLQPALMKYKN